MLKVLDALLLEHEQCEFSNPHCLNKSSLKGMIHPKIKIVIINFMINPYDVSELLLLKEAFRYKVMVNVFKI